VYYIEDLTVDGWVQLGNPKVANSNSIGIHWGQAQRLYVRNADIQGHYYGAIARGRGVAELFVLENAYLRNRVNLWVRPWTQNPPSGKRQTFMQDVVFDKQPGSPTQHAIQMLWNPSSSASKNTPDLLYVRNYNRQFGLDFRVFYKEQLTNASIAGGNAGICTATRPEIAGYVCPWVIPPYDLGP
jgi:hypothetical protein